MTLGQGYLTAVGIWLLLTYVVYCRYPCEILPAVQPRGLAELVEHHPGNRAGAGRGRGRCDQLRVRAGGQQQRHAHLGYSGIHSYTL